MSCPHCASAKVVKNEKKGNGRQNFKCKTCEGNGGRKLERKSPTR
ncbi:MAG: IS1 family transposase [Bacteroidia bacterium]